MLNLVYFSLFRLCAWDFTCLAGLTLKSRLSRKRARKSSKKLRLLSMSSKRKLIYGASLTLAIVSLSACSCKINYNNCPVYPVGGQKVGQELSKLNTAEYPALFDWIGRINKLRLELELCERK